MDMMETEHLLKIAERAARGAGQVLLEGFVHDAGVDSEKGKDIKTQADKAAEAEILNAMKPTGFPILSEESGLIPGKDPLPQNLSTLQLFNLSTPIWIIDPLDGTLNFTRGLPMCCVSIGLWAAGEPLLGVIYDFPDDRMISGVVGNGIQVNGEPASVSEVCEAGQAVLFTGFPSARDYSDAALLQTVRDAQQFKKVRMIGSAATSLAHVAQGHGEAYREESIWFWDVAAGLALVKAGGGDYKLGEIGDDWKLDVFAHNGRLGS
jgi:myo-inositol-1(or 4)-monophosphatase